MKKLAILLLTMVAMPAPGHSQEQGGTEFAGRASIAADWKAARGLHISVDYEIRSNDAFSGIERNQIGASVSYKINPYFRVAGGYTYIGHLNSEKTLKPRHRGYVDMTGTLKTGCWRFSLKERLQLTHKSYDINTFQAPVNDLELKSRIKASFRGHRILEPYAFVEIRNTFNAASYTADFNSQTGKYTGYEFAGYKHAYIDRVRMSLGLEWTLGRCHLIDFGFLADRNMKWVLDVNREGTKLKSVSRNCNWALGLAVGYVFSF